MLSLRTGFSRMRFETSTFTFPMTSGALLSKFAYRRLPCFGKDPVISRASLLSSADNGCAFIALTRSSRACAFTMLMRCLAGSMTL